MTNELHALVAWASAHPLQAGGVGYVALGFVVGVTPSRWRGSRWFGFAVQLFHFLGPSRHPDEPGTFKFPLSGFAGVVGAAVAAAADPPAPPR